MPEPPFQNDQQLLPHLVEDADTFFAAIVTVTHPEQLPDALKQHDKQVVIENTQANAWLIYWLKWLLRWKDIFIIGWLLLQAFTLGYNLQYDWHMKWKGVEVGGKITLTARTMTPPAGEE
jgi:hypothetical protein